VARVSSPAARHELSSVVRYFELMASSDLSAGEDTRALPAMIALLDYGSGNIRSVEKALRKVGADVQISRDPKTLKEARGAVLPGVGAFDDCISAMRRQELFDGVK